MGETALHSPAHPNNSDLVEFARREMGSGVKIYDVSRDTGRRSIVWRLTGSDGSRTWLKHHERSQLYKRELIGLELFVPKSGEQTWWCSPTLLAKDDQLEGILLSELEGTVLEQATVSSDEKATMFKLAGRFSRHLHNVDIPAPDEIRAETYIRKRLKSYLSESRISIDTATLNWAQKLVDQAFAGAVVRRVPCHMDFSPRNWIFLRSNDGIRIGIIDWERARWDLWLEDIQRLAYDWWYSEPRLRDAYLKGYGRELTDAEQFQLDALCLVMAIASIRWATNQKDEQFAMHNRLVIERIRAKLNQ